MDTKNFSGQAKGRFAKETNPGASDSPLPREKSESNCRNDRGAPPPSEEKNQNGHPNDSTKDGKKSSNQGTSILAGNVNTSVRVPPPPAKKPNIPGHKLAEKSNTIASAPPMSEKKNQKGQPKDAIEDEKKSSNQGRSLSAGNANLSVRVPPPPAKKPNLPGHKLAEKTNTMASAPPMSEKKNQNGQPKDAPENGKKPSNQRDSKSAGNANLSARVPPPTAKKPSLNGQTQRTQEAGCSFCLKFGGTSMQTTEHNVAASVPSTPRETQQHEHNKVASKDAKTLSSPGPCKSAEETIQSASVPTTLRKLIAHHDQTTVASKAISREGIGRSAEKTHPTAGAPPPSEDKNQNGHPNDSTKDGKKSSNQGTSILAGKTNLSARVPPPPAIKPNLPGHKLAEKTNTIASEPQMSKKKNQNGQPKDAPDNEKKSSNQRDSKSAGNTNISARVPPPTAKKPNLNGQTQSALEAGCSFCSRFAGTPMPTTEVALQQEMKAICPICYRRINFRNKCERTSFEWNIRERNLQ
ncbi:unnamed protein product [Dibothriocephalus latus]|uniref:Uncharacterized protein n=1 Tax=Dibothriocephalus latus TaxID=60516 RepID=A0A3P6TC78_DIBLA|nr:unnamed protein product [Dibothriocephalus latus]